MEKKVKDISAMVNRELEEFYDKCLEFEKSADSKRKKIYTDLRKRYESLMKGKLTKKDKAKLYKKMKKYYKSL